jgi:hypothetical protein
MHESSEDVDLAHMENIVLKQEELKIICLVREGLK